MYVLITQRLVKMNTGATTQYAPRTANRWIWTASGPFLSLKAAQRACLHALSVHTTLGAQVWDADQIIQAHAKGYSGNGDEMQKVFVAAMQLLECR